MGVSDRFTSSSYVANVQTSDVKPIQLAPAELIITLLLPRQPDIGAVMFPSMFPKHPSTPSPDGSNPTAAFPTLPATLATHLAQILTLLDLPHTTTLPPLTIILSDSPDCGVAHTTDGTITLSSRYIASRTVSFAEGGNTPADELWKRTRTEIEGVLCHELVHVVQEDGDGSAPGWWIEGVADWVRMKAGLGAGHWRPPGHGKSHIDSYETTALFLSHLTTHVHPPLVALINARLRDSRWEDTWFEEYTGKTVQVLWKEYKTSYAGTKTTGGEARPTHAV